MNATDNILALKEENGKDAFPCNQTKRQRKQVKSRSEVKVKENKADALFNVIEKFANKQNSSDKAGRENIASALLSALSEVSSNQGSPNKSKTSNKVNSVNCENSVAHTGVMDMAVNANSNETETNRKKPVSGKCTKPDESDIKVVVKNAHEKLDTRHVKDRKFDSLEFNVLIARELELISLPNVSPAERSARIEIAKTLCYHKKYLGDEDLREGYDNILKRVEQGKLSWNENLAEKTA